MVISVGSLEQSGGVLEQSGGTLEQAGGAVLDERFAMEAGKWLFASIMAIISLVLPSLERNRKTILVVDTMSRTTTKIRIAAAS